MGNELVKIKKASAVYKDNGKYAYYYKYLDAVHRDNKPIIQKILDGYRIDDDTILQPKTELTNSNRLVCAYDFSKEGKYLFSSFYERKSRVDNTKRRGNFHSVLGFSERVELVKRLCRIFIKLNEQGIRLKNLNEESIIYNDETKRMYFDLYPAWIKQVDTFHWNEEKENPEYYFYRLQRCFQETENNNYLLAILIFKILTGSEVSFGMDTRRRVAVRAKFELLPSFEENLNKFLNGETTMRDLKWMPSEWFELFERRKCLCKKGYFDESGLCDGCGAEKIGKIVSHKAKVLLPLQVPRQESPQEYLWSHFNLNDFSGKLKILAQRAVIDGTANYALFFPVGRIVTIQKRDMPEEALKRLNSSKTMYILPIEKGKNYDFIVRVECGKNDFEAFTIKIK